MTTPQRFQSNLGYRFSRLFRRFNVTGGGGGVELSPIITPITDMDQLLRLVAVKRDTPTTAATGAMTMFTVPAGERWRLFNLAYDRMSGDALGANISILDSSAGFANVIERFSPAASGSFHAHPWWPLDQGDLVRLYISSVSTSSQFEVTALVEFEEAF